MELYCCIQLHCYNNISRDAARIWKGQGFKSEKRAQFILNEILVFTFTFIYLIFNKRLFFCFQPQLIFEEYRFLKHFWGIFLMNIWAKLCMSKLDIRCRCNRFRSLSLFHPFFTLSPIALRYGVFNRLIPDELFQLWLM